MGKQAIEKNQTKVYDGLKLVCCLESSDIVFLGQEAGALFCYAHLIRFVKKWILHNLLLCAEIIMEIPCDNK